MFTPAKTFLSLIVALAFVLGCGSQSTDEAGTITETPATETESAPAPDAASVRTAIEASNAAWAAAAEAGDATALTALYTDDALLLMPDQPMVRGTAGIQSAFESMLSEATIEELTLTTDEVEVSDSGDIAYVVGTSQERGTLADGSAFDDPGKYVAVYENVDGQWKIAVDTWNTNGTTTATE